jgi:hypothetical protein
MGQNVTTPKIVIPAAAKRRDGSRKSLKEPGFPLPREQKAESDGEAFRILSRRIRRSGAGRGSSDRTRPCVEIFYTATCSVFEATRVREIIFCTRS